MSQLLPLLATPSVHLTLRELARGSDSSHPRIHLEDLLYDNGADSAPSLLDQLIGANLLQRIGNQIAISKNGRKVQLLMEAIEGGHIGEICLRLQRIDGKQRYELVREGMTEDFFRGLCDLGATIGTLYICSPWINASENAIKSLHDSFMQHKLRWRQFPELLIVTRPWKDGGEAPSLTPFKRFGARIHLHRTLHSKLYIREPDPRGGTPIAVLGSQNLTRSRYSELGIRITGDDQLVRQLIRYFMELISDSDEST